MFSIVGGRLARILKYDAGGFSRFEPLAVRIVVHELVVRRVGGDLLANPLAEGDRALRRPRNLRFTWSRSAHLFVQCSTYSLLPISRSITRRV